MLMKFKMEPLFEMRVSFSISCKQILLIGYYWKFLLGIFMEKKAGWGGPADIPLVYFNKEGIWFSSSHQFVLEAGFHRSYRGFAWSFMRGYYWHIVFQNIIEKVKIQFMALMIYWTFRKLISVKLRTYQNPSQRVAQSNTQVALVCRCLFVLLTKLSLDGQTSGQIMEQRTSKQISDIQ